MRKKSNCSGSKDLTVSFCLASLASYAQPTCESVLRGKAWSLNDTVFVSQLPSFAMTVLLPIVEPIPISDPIIA